MNKLVFPISILTLQIISMTTVWTPSADEDHERKSELWVFLIFCPFSKVPSFIWTSSEDLYKRAVRLPLKTWWLFFSSVWRPPHSFFRSCRVSCSNSPATSLTERLPEEEGGRRGTGDGGRGMRKGWKMRAKNRETKKQEEVCRCYVHQYINTLLQAGTEIIFIHRYGVRKKHPIHDCDVTSSQWKCSRSERVINAICRTFYRERGGGKTPQSLSFSVSQGCEVCSIKAAPTSCQNNQHAFHRCISHRPLKSVSHCRHSPTGTIILDTKEQK